MAQPKIDRQKVRKIRVAVAQEGKEKTAQRFDKNSPEFRKAEQIRQQRTAHARAKQKDHFNEQEGKKMNQQDPKQKKSPARANSAQAKNQAAAQQRVKAMKAKQARQNVQGKQQGQSQSAGM